MATHIDVLCGDYHNVLARNLKAGAVDEKFKAYAGGANFYALYRIHNLHFARYGAMFLGRKADALAAATRLRSDVPGALLMEAGAVEEAEAVYRADLGLDGAPPRPGWHPRNVWALHGLDECLLRRGETVERAHVRALLDQALARADTPIRASCLCRAAAEAA